MFGDFDFVSIITKNTLKWFGYVDRIDAGRIPESIFNNHHREIDPGIVSKLI